MAAVWIPFIVELYGAVHDDWTTAGKSATTETLTFLVGAAQQNLVDGSSMQKQMDRLTHS